MNPIDEFLKKKEKRTRMNYGWILRQYFQEIKQDPETYFKKKRNYIADVETWWDNHINEVPKTRNTKLSILKSFFDYYEIPYAAKFWKELRNMKKGRRAATLDRVPTQQEFKQMLRHGDIKDKALFLFTVSSGMRIDEVLKLLPNMIEINHDPVMVKIPGSIAKTGDPRITFISQEAKAYLEEWLKIRNKWLKRSIKRTSHICKKDENDKRIFPFAYDVAWTRWTYLLKKTGLDEKDPTTNRYVLHIHCLRKYFISQLKLEIPSVIAEALAGHEEYLDEAYRRYTKKELGEFYKKAEHRITVLETTSNHRVEELDERLKEKDKQITKQAEEIQDLRNQMQKLMVEVLTMKDKEKK